MAPDGGDTICPCVRNDMDDREKIFGAKKIDFKVELELLGVQTLEVALTSSSPSRKRIPRRSGSSCCLSHFGGFLARRPNSRRSLCTS
jgi:hypothetical protein